MKKEISSLRKRKSNYLLLLPIAGAILFLFFYYIAALNYPGGSQANQHSQGFSWQHNYWCNLLNETAINGQPNPGRGYAMAGMMVLCLSLGWFWYFFALYSPLKKSYRISMQVSGASSMCIAFFIFTSLHDAVINAAALLALAALAFTFIGLYKMKWKKLFWFGILNLLLVVLNNWLYYGGGLFYLPVVQKITFGLFLLWVCMVSFRLYNFAGNTAAGYNI
jgi:hypothetical protein